MFGINLIKKDSSNKRVIDIEAISPWIDCSRYLMLFPNEVYLYGDALCNIRATHNTKEYDMGRLKKDIDDIGEFVMSFFEYSTTGVDECECPIIKDAAYKNVSLSANAKKFSGNLKTGYEGIDKFVNKYVVVRLDTDEIYSPLYIPFKSEGVNELFFTIFMFGRDAKIDGFTPVNEHLFNIDGVDVPDTEFYNHPRFAEIVVKTIYKMYDDNPIFFVSDDKFAMDKFYDIINGTPHNNMVAFIGPYSE